MFEEHQELLPPDGKIVRSVLLFFFVIVSGLNVIGQASSVDYQQTVSSWQSKRLAELKSENGWLNLAGLFWLEPGKNTMGKGSGNDFVVDLPGMPDKAGYFLLKNQQVTWVSDSKADTRIMDKKVSKALIFEKAQPVPLVSMGSFRWNIIKRDDKLGVRLRDLHHPELLAVNKIDYYPTDTAWRINAFFVPGKNDSVMITNMIGQTHAQASPGKIRFTVEGKEHTLDALESGKEELFIIFADLTNGEETYASGRYLYVPKADADGRIVLDFNKAINPPCVFTPYATCPIPPRQNRLPFAVTAGEKMYRKE